MKTFLVRAARGFNRLAAARDMQSPERVAMSTEISKRLFTVHEYHRMVEAGILRRTDRVELIRGEVLAMSPIGPPHNGSVLRANNQIMPIV
jgi:hypothetical protein